ncbi:MAG: tetratricopeptide repeat protein [Bdellovibrionales bacterium]
MKKLKSFESDEQIQRQKIILWSLYLELDPNHLPYLEQRGLAYYHQGETEHAKYDLTRYFNFSSIDEASVALKKAYYDVCGRHPDSQFSKRLKPLS